jgi:hypothetical protein
VDSEDTPERWAKSFIQSRASTFPVAYDPQAAITSGLFYFEGDPYAVFVNGNGTISAIVPGAHLGGQVHRRGEEAHSQRN